MKRSRLHDKAIVDVFELQMYLKKRTLSEQWQNSFMFLAYLNRAGIAHCQLDGASASNFSRIATAIEAVVPLQ